MKKIKGKKYSILSGLLKYSFVFVLVFTLILPVLVGAAGPLNNGTPPLNNGTPALNNGTPPLNNGTPGVNINTNIENPLGNNIVDLSTFIQAVVKIVLVVGIPLLALAIIYAGFLFVKAQGNSEELTKAKHALLYTVIGGALLLGAFVISNAIVSTVKEIGQGAQ